MSIAEAIRINKLKKLDSSLRYSETRDKLMHEHSEYVKSLLKGEITDVGAPLRAEYYRLLEYYYKDTFSIPKHSKRSVSAWERVYKACLESGVAPHNFMIAQFTYFHNLFGKAPTIPQLCTQAAVNRARDFEGLAPAKISRGVIQHKIGFVELMQSAEAEVQDLMRIHKISREDVYRKFVLTGVLSLPPEFLDVDPAYRAAKLG